MEKKVVSQFSRFADRIFSSEGGYVDHPKDKGGPTNFGITLDTLKRWRDDPKLTSADVKALTKEEAFEIYEKQYFTGPGFDSIPDIRLQEFVTDMAVNHGEGNAVKILQKVLNLFTSPPLKVDGAFGGKSLTALINTVSSIGVLTLLNKMIDERALFVARIVEKDPSQSVFIEGWLNRIFSFRNN